MSLETYPRPDLPAEQRVVLDRIDTAEAHGRRWTGVTGDIRREAALALAKLGLVVVMEGAGADRGVLLARRAHGARWSA